MRPLLLLLLLTGCASMHSKIEEIKPTDSEPEILSRLGRPDESSMQGDKTSYVYSGGGDVCTISFIEEKVSATSCHQDPNHVSGWHRFGVFLSGFGGGLQRAGQSIPPPPQSQSCYTSVIGNQAYTNCY